MIDQMSKIKIDDFENSEIEAKQLTQKVLSKKFIKDEIKKLNLNEEQIKKGMIILQRYHDYYVQHNEKPKYKLFVDKYGFLAEDMSSDPNFDKKKKAENFWFTDISPLDPIVRKYFETNAERSVFQNYKKSLKQFLSNQIKTNESENIKKIINVALSKGVLFDNLWFYDQNNSLSTDFIKYISILNAINFNKSVAIINANDLQRYLKFQKEDRNIIISHLNKVDILTIYNVTFGQKDEWFLEFLLEVFDSRNNNNQPILLSTNKDVGSRNSKFLIRYYYNNNTNNNDIENSFKDFIINNFIKIVVNLKK
ncbi:primosome protein [Metamycoplasma phocicerebrale]|uniref:Primosome protein n=1 Tax=Metamycoplasma phocicerebrale TaxID=142649 RepID=A0A3T0TT80_9BACT|nr:primosome protein [Metamycoplasma phocicerebrale]AZZ65302.1 primosome protein [Metamycoplasma phocicerebrale]